MVRPDRTTGFYDPRTETLPPAEREAYLAEKLRQAVRHAYEHAPSVRERMDGAGVSPEAIQGLQDLERLPILRKDELLEYDRRRPQDFGGFLGVPREQVRRIYMSPGPIYEPHAYIGRNVAQGLYAGGVRPGDVAHISYAYHLVPAGFLMEEGLLELGCTIVPAGTGNTELQVQAMQATRATVYVGTPSFLATLLQRAEQMGLRPGNGLALEVGVVGAEPLPESLRNELESRYGILVRQGYGTADLGSIAYECYHKTGMHLVDDLVVEIVDPSTGKALPHGQVGEVVVTSFSPVYCLIRFGTGDAGVLTGDPCPCARTAPRLRLVGRVGDAVKVRGMFVHPRQTDEAMARFPQVARYRILVTREGVRDMMTVQVELREGISLESLQPALADALREATKLRVDRIEAVPPGTIQEGERKVQDLRKWD